MTYACVCLGGAAACAIFHSAQKYFISHSKQYDNIIDYFPKHMEVRYLSPCKGVVDIHVDGLDRCDRHEEHNTLSLSVMKADKLLIMANIHLK